VKTSTLRRAVVPGVAALALAASLAACGSSNNSADNAGGADGGAGSASTSGSLSGTVAGGGSSAQEKAQESWRAGFGQSNSGVTLTYDAVGSGTGRSNFISGAYKYAGSDSAMSADELSQASKTCGGDPVEFPVFISPIDVAFNLKGVTDLNLDAKTVAGIFKGDIKTWDDPAIKALNPDAKLPSTAISPVHRSDSSGTTDNFTDYLHQAAPSVWTNDHSSDWPTTSGESAEGTSGVVGAVQGGNGTIGYIDDSGVEGTKLSVAKIKVGDTYVAPSADGAAAGLAASELATGTPATVMQYNVNRTTTDPKTYPIFMASYEIACQSYSDANTAAVVKAFLTYITSADGQKAAAANAYSAPLPTDVASKEAAIIAKIGS
jgi:phosphate transport system substrate-binding protein